MKRELKKFFSVKNTIILALIVAVLVVGAIFLWEPIAQLYNERHKIEEFILSFGIWAPGLFLLLQIIQVIISPIPGNVTGFVGGYIFGWWGLLLTTIGTLLGFIIIIWLVRRFGRRLIEKFFKPEQIAKFDYITEKNGVMALFLIFLLPFFPDDLISLLAGLTKISWRKLIIVFLLGRLPGNLLLTMMGNGVNDGDINLIVGIVVAVVIIGALILWKKDWLQNFLKADNHLEFLKKSIRKLKKNKK